MSQKYKIECSAESFTVGEQYTFTLVVSKNVIKPKNICWRIKATKKFGDSITHVFTEVGETKVVVIVDCNVSLIKNVTVVDNNNFKVKNSSQDPNIDVVVFQKNVATFDDDNSTVAWNLLKFNKDSLLKGFKYESGLQIQAKDKFGNLSALLTVLPNKKYDFMQDPSGNSLIETDSSSSRTTTFTNKIDEDVTLCVFRCGKLVLQKSNIPPLQQFLFEFKPTLWIGVVSNVTEGGVMTDLSQFNTELGLLGLKKATIEVTGGGAGPSATPFQFILSEIVYL